MKINRRHFVGVLYDCILFEYASLVPADKNHTLSLDDLADTFAFVADFYKHNRSLMDVPCDQFITRNQLHTVVGLVDYIEEMEHGVYEIFPRNVELHEEAPSFASSSSVRRERRRQERKLGSLGMSNSNGKSRTGHDPFNQSGRSWTTDLYSHRRGSHDLHNDTDTDVDDEYSIIIPGLSKTDIQTFLWEYAYVLEDYQDDIATLIRYLRRDEWMMQGSKGSIVMFDWDLEGVQKFSKEYNQNKIRKVELREQEEAKRAQEVAQRQQEEWNRQQELIREQEAAQRMRTTDDFIWKMHKTLAISSTASSEIENLIKNLEMEISEYFGFRFVALAAVGAFVSGSYTHHSDLDLTLTGNIRDITVATLADALRHFTYESVTVTEANTEEQQATVIPGVITFVDPKTGITCHLTLNEPLAIHRSKLIRTYALIEPRFGPVMVALRRLAAQRDLVSGSIHQDRHNDVPIGSYALELMLITFLQTEKPPLLPKLQQAPMEEDNRPMKETFVQGIDCSFDHGWRSYEGFGAKNTKNAAELLVDFCRFFGYVFDYESKEVNPRIGEFRWRPDLLKTSSSAPMIAPTALPVSPLSSPSPLAPSLPTSSAAAAAAAASTSITPGSSTVVFHVMDPFLVGSNVTAVCSDELVKVVKKCFQEAYGALIEGDINLAFSYRTQ